MQRWGQVEAGHRVKRRGWDAQEAEAQSQSQVTSVGRAPQRDAPDGGQGSGRLDSHRGMEGAGARRGSGGPSTAKACGDGSERVLELY